MKGAKQSEILSQQTHLDKLQSELIENLFSAEIENIDWNIFTALFKSPQINAKFGVIFGAILANEKSKDSFLAYYAANRQNGLFLPEAEALLAIDNTSPHDDYLTAALKLILNSDIRHPSPGKTLQQKQIITDASLKILRYLRDHNPEKLDQILNDFSRDVDLFRRALKDDNHELINFYAQQRPDMVLDKSDIMAIAISSPETKQYLAAHPILQPKLMAIAGELKITREARDIFDDLIIRRQANTANFLTKIRAASREAINYNFTDQQQNLLPIYLKYAAYNKDEAMAFFEKSDDVSKIIEVDAANKLTPLFYAIRALDVKAVEFLVKKRKANPDQNITVDGKEKRLLIYAILKYQPSDEATKIFEILINNSNLLDYEANLEAASDFFNKKSASYSHYENTLKIKEEFSTRNTPINSFFRALAEYKNLERGEYYEHERKEDEEEKNLDIAAEKVKEKAAFTIASFKADKSGSKSLVSEAERLKKLGFFIGSIANDQRLEKFFSDNDEQLKLFLSDEPIAALDPQRIEKLSSLVNALTSILDTYKTTSPQDNISAVIRMMRSLSSNALINPNFLKELEPNKIQNLIKAAALYGNVAMVEELINLGAKIDHQTMINLMPQCSEQTINFLITKISGNPAELVQDRFEQAYSILSVAISSNRIGAAETLLNRAEIFFDENAKKEIFTQLKSCTQNTFDHFTALPKFHELFSDQLFHLQQLRIAELTLNKIMVNILERPITKAEIEEMKRNIEAIDPHILQDKINTLGSPAQKGASIITHSLLNLAIEKKPDHSFIKFLLSKNADVDQTIVTAGGALLLEQTPLTASFNSDNWELVKTLINHSKNPTKLLEVGGVRKMTALEIFITEKYSPTPEKNNVLKLLIGKFSESTNTQESLELLELGRAAFKAKFTSIKPTAQDKLVIVEFNKAAKILSDKIAVQTHAAQLELERQRREVEEAKEMQRAKIKADKEAAAELEKLRAAEELQRLERERLELERLEKLELERIEKERLEQARIENERLELEKIEKERLEQIRVERELLNQAVERQRLELERQQEEIANAARKSAPPVIIEESAELIAPAAASSQLVPKNIAEIRLQPERTRMQYIENIAAQEGGNVWRCYNEEYGNYYIHDFDKNLITSCDAESYPDNQFITSNAPSPLVHQVQMPAEGFVRAAQMPPEMLIGLQQQQLQYQAWQIAQQQQQLAQQQQQLMQQHSQIQQLHEHGTPGRQPQPQLGTESLIQQITTSRHS